MDEARFGGHGVQAARTFEVRVPHQRVQLDGTLEIPPQVRGVVLFAHGSGSSRFSQRNRFVAARLHGSQLATLLLDLLTPDEERTDERTRQLRFDIPMLGRRLVSAVDWLAASFGLHDGSLGCFGASTGAAAALIAAAERPGLVGAVVSRGGRPDLAEAALPAVRAPTLLLVGGDDLPVIGLNQEAMDRLRCRKEMRIVPGATHLFEEPGTLETVADLAARWFENNLARRLVATMEPMATP